jgi:hypothetical protein
MVHNKLDVVIGGGDSLLEDDHKAYLGLNKGTRYNSMILTVFRPFPVKNCGAFSETGALPYDLDRDPTKELPWSR